MIVVLRALLDERGDTIDSIVGHMSGSRAHDAACDALGFVPGRISRQYQRGDTAGIFERDLNRHGGIGTDIAGTAR